MAIRVENIHSKVLGQDSTCSMLHFVSSPWWNLQEQQLSQTSSKNLSLRVETPSLCFEEAKHLGQQIEEDQSSHSMESSSQSQRGATTMGKSNSQDQCISSESGPPWLIKAIQIDPAQNESFGKHVEEQPKPAFFPSNLESSANPSQIEFPQSAAQNSMYLLGFLLQQLIFGLWASSHDSAANDGDSTCSRPTAS
nr:uncharacterized protein LOC113695412 isoform X3 [Coffea arabica]